MKRLALLLTAIVSLCAPIAGAQDTAARPEDSITEAELRDHLFFLASDYLGGRPMGSPGFEIAAHYGASQFREGGLPAILKDEASNDTYFQEVPYVVSQALPGARLLIKTGMKETAFEHLKDFKVRGDPGVLKGADGAPVAFVGFGIEEPDSGWDDYAGLDVAGAVVVMLGSVVKADGGAILPAELHEKYSPLPSLGVRVRNLLGKGPKAVVIIMWEPDLFARMGDQMLAATYAPADSAAADAPTHSPLPVLLMVTPEVGRALADDRQFSLAGLYEKGGEGYRTFIIPSAAVELDYEIDSREEKSWNVVACLEGTDAGLAGEYVILCAHLDHIPPIGDQVCNGADDNASGSVGVLEIAEALALAPPKRSVIFVLYTGEDCNSPSLIGSEYFAAHLPVPRESIVAVINLDMICRSDAENEESRAHYVIGQRGLIEPLVDLIGRVNDRTERWPLKTRFNEEVGGVSDHASFQPLGIPAVSFFSGEHEDLHRPTDDAEKADFQKMAAISRLAYQVVLELASSPSPLGAARD